MNMNSDLRPLPGSGTLPVYRTLISGPVSNEFATAAFRMGHSLVQGNVQLFDVTGNPVSYNMANVFNDPTSLISNPDFFDNAIRGLVSQTSQTVDTQIVDDLRRTLFQYSILYRIVYIYHRNYYQTFI